MGGSHGSVIVTIHQPEFLPWLGLIDKIRQAHVTVLLDSVQYEKNYFQNRNRIRTANGWSWLTVPVKTTGRFGQRIDEVEIDTATPWRRKHLQGLRQSYAALDGFDKLFPPLERLYEGTWEHLVELNIAIIEFMLSAFGLNRTIIRSSTLPVQGQRSELLADICTSVGARTYLSGVSGRDYLNEQLFDAAGIAVRYQEFTHPTYPQRYAPFTPMLSAVDLLFNTGGGALQVIEAANRHAATAHAL